MFKLILEKNHQIKKNKIFLKILLCFVLIFFLKSEKCFAESTQPIVATVKSSICGNEILEGGEECDNSDFGNKTCISLGFSGGTLKCDHSCHLDLENCIIPTPTPTLIPTKIPTSSPTSIQTSNSTNNNETVNIQSIQDLILPTKTPIQNLFSPIIPNDPIPAVLNFFGINNSKKLKSNEIFNAVKIWVDEWKNNNQNNLSKNKKCDINNDNQCDTKDFSLLLYYIK